MSQTPTDWTTITIVFTCVFLCATAYVKWKFGHWRRKQVPYIEPSFPMGNLESPWCIKKGFHQTITDLYNKLTEGGYKYSGIYLSLRPVFMPIDLDLIKNILIKDFQYFIDRGLYYNQVHDPLSAHLLSLEGEKWSLLRTKLTPTFTPAKMRAMFQLVLSCGDDLEKEVKKLCENNQRIDIKEVAPLYTTDVIASCAFGIDSGCFENPDNEFRSHTRAFFVGGVERTLRFIITHSFPNLCRKLGVRSYPASMTEFYFNAIKEIIKHRETTNSTRNDFVDLLLEIRKADCEKESLTIVEIAAQCFIFFLASFETSASTMTFAFYEMAKNQDVQNKVREEIRRVIEKHGGKITYDALAEMTYMQQVFDETLRKYPITSRLHRICTKDYKIPGEDLVLEKGTKVLISVYGIQHNPLYYPNPERFDPERFTPEKKAKMHPCTYMPFGEGPKNCIGMRFATMQGKVGMAVMLKDYKYTLAIKGSKLTIDPKVLLLAPLGRVLLNIEKVN